jgi:hypothetical protein
MNRIYRGMEAGGGRGRPPSGREPDVLGPWIAGDGRESLAVPDRGKPGGLLVETLYCLA